MADVLLIVAGVAAWWASGYWLLRDTWLRSYDLRESDRVFCLVCGALGGPLCLGVWLIEAVSSGDWQPGDEVVIRRCETRHADGENDG